MSAAAEVLESEVTDGTEWAASTQIVSYPVTEDDIRKTFAGYDALTFDTPRELWEGKQGDPALRDNAHRHRGAPHGIECARAQVPALSERGSQ